jgi:hypothetical protein
MMRSWWQKWIGRKDLPSDARRHQYADVINKECGLTKELQLNAVDFLIHNLNEGVRGMT